MKCNEEQVRAINSYDIDADEVRDLAADWLEMHDAARVSESRRLELDRLVAEKAAEWKRAENAEDERDSLRKRLAAARAKECRNIAAYALSRADQHQTGSASWAALSELAIEIIESEHDMAAECGDLDGIYYRVDSVAERVNSRAKEGK